LFVDIASSTERAATLGDTRWRNVLNSYYVIVRKEFSRFRGKERNTTGDGFLATFDGPARAIRCALAIAQTVKQLRIVPSSRPRAEIRHFRSRYSLHVPRAPDGGIACLSNESLITLKGVTEAWLIR
jgi:class 3 adenylate cyclase